MIKQNLLKNPYWTSDDLGKSIPDSPHAVSVSLPHWSDVIAYEEKDQKCMKKLNTIYPRFGFNPYVKELSENVLRSSALNGWSAWPYQDYITARKAKNFCEGNLSISNTNIIEVNNIYYLLANEKVTFKAKSFWQHTGLGLSSRIAAISLGKEVNISTKENTIFAERKIKTRLANLYSCEASNIELHPSGMASLYRALEIIYKIFPPRKTLQIGFPYVDVLKLPKNIFNGADLIVDNNIDQIKTIIKERNPAAIIIEIPSNPLLKCVDLPQISNIAHEYGIPLIVDDTIGTPINVSCLQYADMIFSSLTKIFAGRGDILAGCLIINSQSQWGDKLRKTASQIPTTYLSDPDIIELELTSRDVSERTQTLNKTCRKLKKKLEVHPKVKSVFHPESCINFNNLIKENGGYGCLLSFELNEDMIDIKKFYNSLKVCKGPSLGTNFTLACPYVLLAHYEELDWARSHGLSSHLIRVSVGMEHPDELWERFQSALST